MKGDNVSFSTWSVCGWNYLTRHALDEPIVFHNHATGATRTIVAADGTIVDFPGIAHPRVVEAYAAGRTESHRVRFPSGITSVGDEWALRWQIQPEGRYWEGDGYGNTCDEEVCLYAPIDEEGRLSEPFRLYSVNTSVLAHTGAEEELDAALDVHVDLEAYLAEQVGAALSELSLLVACGQQGVTHLDLPGTVLRVTLRLRHDGGMWRVTEDFRRRYSGVSLFALLPPVATAERHHYLTSESTAAELLDKIWGQIAYVRDEQGWLPDDV